MIKKTTTTTTIFLIDGALSPQSRFEAVAGHMEAEICAEITRRFKQKAHIDEIKRLCHVPVER